MRKFLLLLLMFSCSNEPFEVVENEVLMAREDWTKMCDLEPIDNISYSIQQYQGTSYWLVASNGTREQLSFSNAVSHCCDYGTGGGCDFPPTPIEAKSSYTEKLNE